MPKPWVFNEVVIVLIKNPYYYILSLDMLKGATALSNISHLTG
jgi:hypothetical protein